MNRIYVRLKKKLIIVRIIRPIACIVGMSATGLVQQRLELNSGLEFSFFLLPIAIALQIAGAFACNDFFDLDHDKKNHPNRALPLELIEPITVLRISLLFLTISSCLGLVVDIKIGLLISLNNLVLYFYSHIKKTNGALGNIIACYSCTTVLILPALLVGELLRIIPLSLTLFFIALSRELIMDVHDSDGDRLAGIRSAATIHGADVAFKSAWFCILISWSIFLYTNVMQIGNSSHHTPFLSLITCCLTIISICMFIYQKNRNQLGYLVFRYGGFGGFIVALPAINWI